MVKLFLVKFLSVLLEFHENNLSKQFKSMNNNHIKKAVKILECLTNFWTHKILKVKNIKYKVESICMWIDIKSI